MSIRPLHDRILIERIEEGDTTNAGIIIPDKAKEKPQRGKVLAAGSGKVRDDGSLRPLDVKAGDVVLFAKYGGAEIQVDGQDRLIMREDDILAVIE
jgi:chaperonin GroES